MQLENRNLSQLKKKTKKDVISINMGCCGLDCEKCSAYIATKANSDELRAKTAKEWSKQFNVSIKPEEINCLGCKSKVIISNCNYCDTRKCAMSKKLDHCGKCSSFSCDKVEEILEHAPHARRNLEKG